MPRDETRVDLHCHSTASATSKLGVQRALALPECATPPDEVYALAKRRGMDLVTITDHDTISGASAIADRPDTFISEELTAGFRGEPLAATCTSITSPARSPIPSSPVAAPRTARHRRRLARLFPIWEVRNGAREPELNQPAAFYVDTHGDAGVGGSDDHGGVDVGRTFTVGPRALRERLALGGRDAVRGTTREAALGRLGDGWRIALDGARTPVREAA